MAPLRRAALAASAAALALLLSAPPRAAAVQELALARWLASDHGLSMSMADAEALAKKEATTLSACGMDLPALQELRDVVRSPSNMDMTLVKTRAYLLQLAHQRASPKQLLALYKTMFSTGGLDMQKSEAASYAIVLATRHAEPYLLGPLYRALRSPSGVDLRKSQAQLLANALALAGADAETLLASFRRERRRTSSDAALEIAVQEAVVKNLEGLVQRYAKDGKAYTAKEFQTHYGADRWQAEWQLAPQQKRTANDGKDYLASEFLEFYGTSWSSRWSAAPVAELRRIAKDDGKTYTMNEFFKHYGDSWQVYWFAAAEVLDVCAGLNHDACDAKATKCQWKWSGDWTDSCVVKPLGDLQAEVVV